MAEIWCTCLLGEYLGVFFSFFENFDFGAIMGPKTSKMGPKPLGHTREGINHWIFFFYCFYYLKVFKVLWAQKPQEWAQTFRVLQGVHRSLVFFHSGVLVKCLGKILRVNFLFLEILIFGPFLTGGRWKKF